MERMSKVLGAESGPAGAPDWAVQVEELHCPMCAYNLRGLTEPRCPECGYQFARAELSDPERRDHPYLFEHHARQWYWSFWRTAIGGLRPIKFWKGLGPQQKSRPGLLLIYWLAAMAVGFASVFAGRCVEIWRWAAQMHAAWPNSRMPTYKQMVEVVLPMDLSWWAILLFPYWPVATLLVLQIFRQSMKRAKVGRSHVRRVVAYSSDGAMWLAIIGFPIYALLGVASSHNFRRIYVFDAFDRINLCVAGGLVVIGCWMAFRIYVGYRFYLRFDRPFLTILASQFIVVLLGFTIYVCLAPIHGWRM